MIMNELKARRSTSRSFNTEEENIINIVREQTQQGNIDNISRTECYADFYERNKEVKWSFLASMVSRNAGWNMTDLQGGWFPLIIDDGKRKRLFLTYERANWLIFSDAFPQLLIYEISKQLNKPMFHLLKAFSVSIFIETEWEIFWKFRNGNRLITSQIINEQNLIQRPVIEHPIYKKRVFHSALYKIQDWLHFSAVIFPTLEGRLFGYSVHGFQSVDNRIKLGKGLAELLFHQNYYDKFYEFSRSTVHTGSRFDYETYLSINNRRDTPYLRLTYPIIKHHRAFVQEDWFKGKWKEKWYTPEKLSSDYDITNWYMKKRKQLKIAITLEQLFKG